jgi:hypothetical protein
MLFGVGGPSLLLDMGVFVLVCFQDSGWGQGRSIADVGNSLWISLNTEQDTNKDLKKKIRAGG